MLQHKITPEVEKRVQECPLLIVIVPLNPSLRMIRGTTKLLDQHKGPPGLKCPWGRHFK